MPTLRLPREYYLKRAVTCYEHVGDLRAAAEVLAGFGTPQASADAARRFLALGDLPAAGEAFLAAQQPQAALDCFRRAHLPERALACLQLLGDDAQAGALLLELGRHAEAVPLLARALAQATAPVAQAALRFQLAQALGAGDGDAHYRAGLAQLAQLEARPTSADAWAALGAWGTALGRQDRMQEGYAQALRLLEGVRDQRRWQAIATRYRAAAEASGNRRLVRELDAQLAEQAAPLDTTPPPDPAEALLEAERWADALRALEPRARSGDELALRLLATMVEGAGESSVSRALPPLPQRRTAAALLGELGDPRPGVATLEPAWCGPFPAGKYRIGAQRDTYNNATFTPQELRLAEFRIARYPVTNAQYRRFVEGGGYAERRWWTANGWAYLQPGSQRFFKSSDTQITQPRYWDNQTYNQPNQPVVGVSWYEAAAYCAWLTAQGQAAGWLPVGEAIRLPSEAEWEVAAFWDRAAGQLRAWSPSENELWQNVTEAEIGAPSPVGLFAQGAVPCSALDMAGNVWEWCASRYGDYPHAAAQLQSDFEPLTLSIGPDPVLRGGAFNLQNVSSSCGARYWYYPIIRDNLVSFRVVLSRALSV